MPDVLKAIRLEALRVGRDLSRDDRTIRGVWHNEYALKLTDASSLLSLQYVVLQTTHQGCCYFDGPLGAPPATILGRDAIRVRAGRAFEVAAYDAILQSAIGSPDIAIIDGSPSEKASQRARLVAHEVSQLAEALSMSRARVVMVGVVGEILSLLHALPVTVRGTDFAPHISGRRISGVEVRSGHHTLEEVRHADIALVTGMTIANGTIDEILTAAHESDTRVVMFCETGSAFGPVLLSLGVSCVVAEPYPFYLVASGQTEIRIYRA